MLIINPKYRVAVQVLSWMRIGGLLAWVASNAQAAPITTWTGGAADGGEYTTTGNWDNGVPTSSNSAYLNGGSPSITISSGDSNQTTQQLFVVNGADGSLSIAPGKTLELTGGASGPAARIYEGSTLNLSGGGTVLVDSQSFSVGRTDDDGTTPTNGTLTISGSTALNLDQTVYTNLYVGIGNDVAGSTGTVTQSDTSAVTIGSNMILGDTGGTASYTLNDHSVLKTGTNYVSSGGSFIYIGLNEDGTSSTADAATSGTLTLNGDSEFDFSAGYLKLGDNLDNGSSFIAGKGTIIQNDSSVVNVTAAGGGSFSIGNAQGGTSGGNPVVTGEYDLNGGTLTVNQGSTTNGFIIGGNTGSAGLLKQMGGAFDAVTNIIVGSSGTGIYTITSGTGTFGGGLSIGSLGTVNLNGGTIVASGTNGISGSGALNLGGGTLQAGTSALTTSVTTTLTSGTTSTIDATNHDITFSGTFGGSGAFTKIGSNILTLAGGGAIGNETSSSEVDGGALTINSSTATTGLGTLLIGTSAGSGTLNVNSDFQFGSGNVGGSGVGYLRVGYNGTGTLNLSSGTLSFLPADTLSQLNIGGGSSTGNGTLTMTGGTLDLDMVTSGNYAYLTVGRNGATGVVNQSAGTTETGGSVIIGVDGGTGTYNLSGGTFTSGTNWSGAHVYIGLNQGNADTTSGTFTVSGTGDFTMAAHSYLDIGTGFSGTGATGATGIFTQNGGTVNLNGDGFGVGDNAGGVGGTGTYNLQSGTLNVNSGYFEIGYGSGSTGTFTQFGGTLVSSVGILLGGSSGSGAYNLNGGTLEVGGSGGISAGSGTSVVNGAGGTLQATSNLTSNVPLTLASNTYTVINTNGFDVTLSGGVNNTSDNNGGLTKTGTGNLQFTGASNTISSFYINGGDFNQSSGTLTTYEVGVGSGGNTGSYSMSGGSLVLPAGTVPAIVGGSTTRASLRVGDFGGTGVFTQMGGTVTDGGSLNIGNRGGTGTYDISAGEVDLSALLNIIGRNDPRDGTGSYTALGSSHGTLTISGTGVVSAASGASLILSSIQGSNIPSVAQGSTGTITQTGGTLDIQNGATLYLSGYGTGEYDLDGGALEVGGSGLAANFGGGGSYTFNLGGGTLQVNGSDLTSSVNATLTAATTSTIDTNSFNATLSGTFGGTGALSKVGPGALVLTGPNSYSGGTTISGGTLYANNTSVGTSGTGTGLVEVSNGGTLAGLGTVATGTNPITVDTGGTLAPGGVQSGTTANGNLSLDTTGLTTGGTVANLSANSKMTFALGTGDANGGSKLLVGGTTANVINFNIGGTGSTSTVVSINDLTGGALTLNQNYVLIAGNGNTTFEDDGQVLAIGDPDGLVSADGLILDGLGLLVPTPGNRFSQWYTSSQLFLVGDDIEVDVESVPEPGTWPILLGGMALLFLCRRRRQAGT